MEIEGVKIERDSYLESYISKKTGYHQDSIRITKIQERDPSPKNKLKDGRAVYVIDQWVNMDESSIDFIGWFINGRFYKG